MRADAVKHPLLKGPELGLAGWPGPDQASGEQVVAPWGFAPLRWLWPLASC